MEKIKFKSVDDYKDSFPINIQLKIEEIRNIIKTVEPNVSEIISYNMPAYKLSRIVVYFAVYKNHIGFYSMPNSIIHFKNELTNYKTSKGTIQFKNELPLPLNLIKRIVEFRVNEVKNKLKELKK